VLHPYSTLSLQGIEVIMKTIFRIRFSVDDFVAYLWVHDQPKLPSKLGVLARDSNPKVRALALDAAKKSAATSPLNRMRLEGMGLIPK
jgi:hypothetical protein